MSLWRGVCKGRLQICVPGHQRCVGTYARPALQNHYQVLGLERNASSGEIKEAFITLSKKCHPDTNPSNPLLHAQFVCINEAYNVLSRNSSRREYDQVLEAIQRAWPSADRSQRRTSTKGPSTTKDYRKKEEPNSWSASDSDSFYWSQFAPWSDSHEPLKDHEQRNRNIAWACTLICLLSTSLYFFAFSSARDMRNKHLKEMQKKIWDSYNMTREKARMTSFSKQQEILLQRHEERLKKLYGREDDPNK